MDVLRYLLHAPGERPYLVQIQRLIGQTIPVVEDHPYASPLGLPEPPDLRPRHRRRQPRRTSQAESASPRATGRRRRRRRPKEQRVSS